MSGIKYSFEDTLRGVVYIFCEPVISCGFIVSGSVCCCTVFRCFACVCGFAMGDLENSVFVSGFALNSIILS